MRGQGCLEGIEAPYVVGRLHPATVLAGRRWLAECRAILAAAEKSKEGTCTVSAESVR